MSIIDHKNLHNIIMNDNRSEYEIETDILREKLVNHLKLQKTNNKKAVFISKIEEILDHDNCKLMADKDYKELVYDNFSYDALNEFEPELEIVPEVGTPDYKELNDIWNYFRIHQSSAVGNKKPAGRRIRILVRDKTSKKYVGLLSIDSDMIENKKRDKFIGWSHEMKEKRLQYIINVKTCIGLQGFASNTSLGKLLIMLTFSQDIQDIYHEKYKDKEQTKYVGVLTTSIQSKSIQYNDIPYLNYLGDTNGINVGDIPESLYQQCVAYYTKYVSSNKPKRKIYLMDKLCLYLNIRDKFNEGKQTRGIYFRFLSKDSKDFLNGNIDKIDLKLKTIKQITKYWKTKYARPRYIKLYEKNSLKKQVTLDDQLKRIRQNKYTKTYMLKQINILGIKKINEINRLKVENFRIMQKILPINPIFSKYKLDPSYLAGFIDGDGSIYVCDNLSLQITITQCEYNVLLIINNHFNNIGNIYSYDKKNNKILTDVDDDDQLPKDDIEKINKKFGQRNIYNLRFTGLCCKPVLEYIKDFIVIKHKQCKYALEYTSYIRKKRTDKKIETKDIIKSLNNNTTKQLKCNRINETYICGLFDAEGCVRADGYNTLKSYNGSIKISQLKYPDVLHCVNDYLDNIGRIKKDKINGVERESYFIAQYSRMRQFLLKNSKYLIVKRIQLEAMEEIYKTLNHMGKKLPEYVMEIRQHNVDLIYSLKHDNTDPIPNDVLFEYNASNRKDTKEHKKNLKIIENIKSMTLCGCGISYSNNYIKRHQMLYCNLNDKNIDVNIGKKISDAKLLNGSNIKIKDITIEEIRNDLNNKMSITNIIRKYKLHSSMIYNIQNGLIVPSYERCNAFVEYYKKIQKRNNELKVKKYELFGDDKIKIQKYNNTMNRRKFDFKTAINIIKFKDSNKTQDDVYNMKFKRTDGERITLEQIKNLWSGSTKLHDYEFDENSEISYDEYLKYITTKGSNNKNGSNRKISDDELKIAYKMVEKKPKITLKELCELFDIDTSTAEKIKNKEFTFKDMSLDEYNEVKQRLKNKQIEYNKLFEKMDTKYSGKTYGSWKKSYKARLLKGVTIQIIVEILNRKGGDDYKVIADDINQKYGLKLDNKYLQCLCSKKMTLYEYDFDILIFPEQTMTYEEAIECKNKVATTAIKGRSKGYTPEQEKEIIDLFMNNIKITAISIANKYGIDRNAVSLMKNKAIKQIQEEQKRIEDL